MQNNKKNFIKLFKEHLSTKRDYLIKVVVEKEFTDNKVEHIKSDATDDTCVPLVNYICQINCFIFLTESAIIYL